MLIKVKIGDKTVEFNSQEHVIAILLDDGNRQVIDNMPPDERLIVSGPITAFHGNKEKIMAWATTGWKHAKLIPGILLGQDGKPLDS